ncbi:hypothetical protein FA10DRAFT_30931 [Acaromyces ingoldii]|uniref:Uncharacterized protein n=1 Tax=Acaromyces ingoldii TaxID=215250 RepID=A0A316YYC2_9BASI|nr:hypothetical protein FA10DRAFT_30931 [Acaromyces ingoldii]PWN93764.1 hypothetical protein FA10DRAFT_30931 [Acaromyces ingoldii]
MVRLPLPSSRIPSFESSSSSFPSSSSSSMPRWPATSYESTWSCSSSSSEYASSTLSLFVGFFTLLLFLLPLLAATLLFICLLRRSASFLASSLRSLATSSFRLWSSLANSVSRSR